MSTKRKIPDKYLKYSNAEGVIYNGDSIVLLKYIESESVDLIFADPPFNIGKEYGEEVNDKMSERDYIRWCYRWIRQCDRILKVGGSIFIYNLPKWNSILSYYMMEIGLEFRHWIAVDYKSSLPIQNKLYPAHYSLLYFTKGKPKYFNRPKIPIMTCRHCGKEIKNYGGYRDKIHPDGINLSDVWTDISPVRHKKKKNRSQNELPEKMIERILSISTVEGDVVLDPFFGSGTTGFVASKMKRKWMGIEIASCQEAIDRLQVLVGEEDA